MTSDRGWSADVGLHGSEYVVKRDIPNWEPCPNGPPGRDTNRFYPVDERAGWQPIPLRRRWLAWTRRPETAARAASTKALVVSLPFRLDKVS